MRCSSHARQSLIELHARQMRSALAPSEARLFRAIRAKQLGATFRRQVVVGGRFIADFVAPAVGLIVEVDGPHHAGRRAADARRDRVLARTGYRVLRLPAELVEHQLGEALARVGDAIGLP
jgi:very-short-patch-repair endonuclease